jgi:Ni/Co efflux regulator RcnB
MKTVQRLLLAVAMLFAAGAAVAGPDDHRDHDRWARGHYYGGPRYYVNNWDYYHLRRPPYGYRWVRSDNDFLLVAVATGIILDMAIR